MSKGKIKKYDLERGCGIIIDSATGRQLTVYANYLKLIKGEILQEGQPVEYEIENNYNRNWAINVRVV
ncbi:MAG: hypothetical protein A2787_04720 [Omnitrophica WOR_2 bacterium RIFCSPHIGHO2_01_FULL_48_9]|nr:MAG: hypothetical protein A3D10_03580 [Omnitrophica WOR_2 bacterium RIFCSPHIGHO2_02_FULL_48_11]OGX32244.1 MAG: hypothetical protein A2787_04720 [Omnitrophica WOR_2 bacterium RIFCSPHIGHO2_01_FULL_48_9]